MRHLTEYEVKSTLQMGWADLDNGDLLTTAEAAGFTVMLTCDKNIQKQQTMTGRSISLIVLRAHNNALETHIAMLAEVRNVLGVIETGQIIELLHPILKR